MINGEMRQTIDGFHRVPRGSEIVFSGDDLAAASALWDGFGSVTQLSDDSLDRVT